MSVKESARLSPAGFKDPGYQLCYDYWLKLRANRAAPHWQEWRWSEIPSDLIPYFIVVDVSYAPLQFTYRFWGTANLKMHGIEMTHKTTADIRSPATAKNTNDHYSIVVENCQAISAVYQMQTTQSGIVHSQVALRMPMSNNDDRVDQIISFIDWRTRHQQIRAEHQDAYES